MAEVILTDEQKIKDIAGRMEAFRKDMEEAIKKHNIVPEAEMNYTNVGISTGILLNDMKYKSRELNDRARYEISKGILDKLNKSEK